MKLKQLLLIIVLLIASCFIFFPLVAQPTTVGLVTYFKLDGNLTNTGPASVTATTTGTSYTTNSVNVANKAIQFAGNLNSYIDFIDNGNFDFTTANNFTISCSFYFNSTESACGLIDNCLNYNGWGLWFWQNIPGTWNIQFNFRNGSVGSPGATAFTLGTWHHVAVARNSGTLSVYIDGVFKLSGPEGTGTPSYPINTVAGAFGYGAYTPPRYNPLNGKMDEIRIYNRALTASEIAILAPYSLPLKMGEFTAVKQAAGIRLNWETLSEQNTSHFEVERSKDGTAYTSIGTVTAAGNSSDKRTYTFLDVNPGSGTNFYRLKQVDIDGAFTYSRIVVVKNNSSLQLELFPNPARDVLQVQIPAEEKEQVTISVTDMTGKIISTKQLQLSEGNNTVSIPVVQLASGTYYLILDNNEGRQARSFIKQ